MYSVSPFFKHIFIIINSFSFKAHESDESEKQCSACTSFICKDKDYEKIVGSACTETVKEICQEKWDDSMFQKIAKNDSFENVYGDRFFLSCQEDFCNTLHVYGELGRDESLKIFANLLDQKSSHDKNDEIRPWHQTDQEKRKKVVKIPDMKVDDSIKIFGGLSDHKLSSRHKRDLDIVCKANDKEVPCVQWEKKCFLKDEEVACNEDNKCYRNSVEYPCNGNDKHICKLNGKEISCDGTSKRCYSNRREVSCDAPDENDADANKKVVENGGNEVAASNKESKTPDENASIKYGNGFALIIASFFAYLFFR